MTLAMQKTEKFIPVYSRESALLKFPYVCGCIYYLPVSKHEALETLQIHSKVIQLHSDFLNQRQW